MPNFAYAVATAPLVAASGNIVAPTLSAPGVVIPFTASGGARQNVRGSTVAAALRAQYSNLLNPMGDVSADANLPSLLASGVGATASWTSPILPSQGFTHTSFNIASNKGGTVVLSQYSDQLAQLLAASTTVVMTASQACVLDVASTVLFQSYVYTINNTASSAATISTAVALLAAE